MNSSQSLHQRLAAGELDSQSRGAFVSKTYAHLFGAVSAFILIEMFLFKTGMAETIARSLMGVSWLFVLGGFVVISWLASPTAHMATSKVAQYAALAGYVVDESFIFVPLLYIANNADPGSFTRAASVPFQRFALYTA